LDDNSSHPVILNFAWEYSELSQQLKAKSVVVETPQAPSELSEQSLQDIVRLAVSRLRENVV
jgi:hypothetical protein